MSKDFLEKTDVNSVRYSGIGGGCTLELALKASARHWVENAPIVADGNTSKGDISEKKVTDGNASKHNIRLVAKMQSPSSMHGDSGVHQRCLCWESWSHD